MSCPTRTIRSASWSMLVGTAAAFSGVTFCTAAGPTPTMPATWYAFVLAAVPLAMRIFDSLTVSVAALLGASVSYPCLDSFIWK